MEQFCLDIQVVVQEPNVDEARETLRRLMELIFDDESVLEMNGSVIGTNVDTKKNVR